MDNLNRNLPENLEEEHRRLAVQIGRELAQDNYAQALRWLDLLLGLKIRTTWPSCLAGPAENVLSFWIEVLASGLSNKK